MVDCREGMLQKTVKLDSMGKNDFFSTEISLKYWVQNGYGDFSC